MTEQRNQWGKVVANAGEVIQFIILIIFFGVSVYIAFRYGPGFLNVDATVFHVLLIISLGLLFGGNAIWWVYVYNTFKDLERQEEERIAREEHLKVEREKRQEALANADSAVKYVVELLDQEHQAQTQELATLKELVKRRPLQAFLTNLGWGVFGIFGGVAAGVLATKLLH